MPIKKKTSYQKAALKRTRAAALKANAAQPKTRPWEKRESFCCTYGQEEG